MNRLIKWIFLLAMAGSQVPGYSQETIDSVEMSSPRWVLKFSPLALVELPQPSLQVALEYPLGQNYSLQHELGWLPPVAFLFTMSGAREPLSGGKVKTEIRRYFQPSSSLSPDIQGSDGVLLPRRDYFALEGLYRFRGVKHRDWQLVNNSNFYQWDEWVEYRYNVAFHVKYGIQILVPGSKNLIIDSYAGIGFRQYFEKHRSLFDLHGSADFYPESYNYLLPSLSLGFKLGFGL